MSNLRLYNIYEKTNKKSNLSLKELNWEFARSPVIYINSTMHIVIDGINASVDDVTIDISSMTISNFVTWLRANGVGCDIINPKYAAYPAVLLSDINSINERIEDVKHSPQDMMELGITYPEAIYNIEETIVYDILKVLIDDKSQDFNYINYRLYTHPESIVVFKEKYTKFILNAQASKAINTLPLAENPDSPISIFSMEAMTDGNY